MLSRMFYKIVLSLSLILVMQQNTFAQKTKDELKAEREVLKAEMKSKDAEDRKAKFEKLTEPKTSGISSVDGLATNSTKMLVSTKEINAIVPEMYKRTVGESVDGVADVTELTALGLNIATQIKAVSDASASVTTASADIKNAGMMQAPKGTKSLNYSKEVLGLVLPELNLNLKVVNNLIATLKSSGNY